MPSSVLPCCIAVDQNRCLTWSIHASHRCWRFNSTLAPSFISVASGRVHQWNFIPIWPISVARRFPFLRIPVLPTLNNKFHLFQCGLKFIAINIFDPVFNNAFNPIKQCIIRKTRRVAIKNWIAFQPLTTKWFIWWLDQRCAGVTCRWCKHIRQRSSRCRKRISRLYSHRKRPGCFKIRNWTRAHHFC